MHVYICAMVEFCWGVCSFTTFLLQQGDSPLYWAARHGHLEVVRHLCESGATLDQQDKVNLSILPLSVTCTYLLSHSFPHSRAHYTHSLSIHSLSHSLTLLLSFSLSLTCSLSLFPLFSAPPSFITLQSGETALHVSARYGHPEVLAFLCQSGATLNIQDKVP